MSDSPPWEGLYIAEPLKKGGDFMFKKGFKKQIAIALALTACMGMTSAFAAEMATAEATGQAIVSPRYTAITNADCEFNLQNGVAYCKGYTYVQSGYKAGVVVELQKNNGGWKTFKTWTANGGTYATVNETYSVSSGYSYRIKVTHKAYDSTGSLVEVVTTYGD